MSDDSSCIHNLASDIDGAVASVKGLQERVEILESKIRTDRVEFLTFRERTERILGCETRKRKRRAPSSPTETLTVETETLANPERTLCLRSSTPREVRLRDPRARSPPPTDSLSVETDSVRSDPRSPPALKPSPSNNPVAPRIFVVGALVRIIGGKKPSQYKGNTYCVIKPCGSRFSTISNVAFPEEPTLKRANDSLELIHNYAA